MSHNRRDDDLAYGDDNRQQREEGEEGERGLIGDVGKRFFGGGKQEASQQQASQQGGGGFFDSIHKVVHDIGSDLKEKISGKEESHEQKPAHQGYGEQAVQPPQPGQEVHSDHRFSSFAPERQGNDIKWYVDGCGYMYAVSLALEHARESIWILDWWLSPELYLRRPPAKNQDYRVDRMLQAAAQRGVKVNIIVYKEVTQALTRKLLTPHLPNYIHSLLPRSLDPITRVLTRLGLDVIFKSLEEVERTDPLIAPPITVSSSHTKHHLEDLHPNIAVFRHPDHLPDTAALGGELIESLQNMSFSPAKISQLPGDSLKAIYGAHDDTVLYWAHHEKLCLVDGEIAFMGGLDLCYGRWDTNQHSIADAHPGDLDRIIFPGQDYNNARILDFQDVANWENNKLDRAQNSRMGWSDVSLCLTGPAVQDLRTHFSQRWNFIFDVKYSYKDAHDRYTRLPEIGSGAQYAPGSQRGLDNEEEGERGFGADEHDGQGGSGERGLLGSSGGFRQTLISRLGESYKQYSHHGEGQQGQQQQHEQPHEQQQQHQRYQQPSHAEHNAQRGQKDCQLTRSSAKWSHNIKTEHSIQNAYSEIIKNSKNFVYIENQFFITATGDEQKPVKNQVGAAIVERIIRAARNGERWKMMVVMPSVPAFAGDLQSDDALGTRAIMEFQYQSINRGGHSIYEEVAKAGFNPVDYIRFYNLRNYDRINASGAMRAAERDAGVSYDQAREGYDASNEATRGGDFEGSRGEYQAYRPPPTAEYGVYEMDASSGGNYNQDQGQYGQGRHEKPDDDKRDDYQKYQNAASNMGSHSGGSGRWDTVSECYMLGGEDIRNVPWEGGNMAEIDAFISEELYVHSKLLIADDEVVICGSANMNDRSQCGDHDSEIAIVIRDTETVDSFMDGRQHRAAKFASSLRRQIFRKHLGLLPTQDCEKPNNNFKPIGVPNEYDWNSSEDQQVADPLSEDFQNLWNWRSKTNTESFEKVFHPVPSDQVRNWKQYKEYYSRFFAQEEGDKEDKAPSKYKWGHVVAENFPQGEEGIREVKEVLSGIKGTVVDMSLQFLIEEDMAKEGLGLNVVTEDIYT
ncbi:phospholipase D/nuclease [Massarina eburnea CBS 473.64]|uniref:Phospholipase n=1 Tax=Massarina eburnea CBS 473.64 TaxID=1395130 RepID=A0A6A6SAB1_9PLEO|nr:phospholipase D/nuclease [Massarina eburnea CBS 473.64]